MKIFNFKEKEPIQTKFNPGDVVELNSGSIRMNVSWTNDCGKVFLKYFDSNQKLQEITLSESVLKKINL